MPPKPLFCINPQCQQPNHPNNKDSKTKYCQSCGSELLLNGKLRASRLLSNDSGFGDVYEVYDGFSPCILKVLKTQWNNEPKAIELFKREYDVLAQLTKQGIKAIPHAIDYFEYQTRNGLTLYCLVMEKVEGIDLIQWLKQYDKLNQKQALKWLREITLILDKVHSKNYFHRDLKPHNIMIRNSGELVLIDFGTAREETQTYYQKVQGKQVTGITSAGYTPIEQQNGQAVTQSDFFALGRTFVHLLTGKQPLDPVMYDGMRDVLNWRGHTENINPLLLDFIDYLMARIADDRPENTKIILQLLDSLEQNLKQPQKIIPPTIPVLPPQPLEKQKSNLPPPQQKPQNDVIKNSLIFVGGITLLSLGIVFFRDISIVLFRRFQPIPEITSTPIETPTPETTNIPIETQIKSINYENISLTNTIPSYTGACVDCLKFSPDGKILASPSDDYTIKLWDVATATEINSLFSHSNKVFFVAFSPDGEILASASADNTIKLWNVTTGNIIKTLFGHGDKVQSIVFSPDGRILASSSSDKTIKLWDMTTGNLINTLYGHSNWVFSIAFSPDSKILASGGIDRTIKLWDVATGREINTLYGHNDSILSMVFSPDGEILASGSNDDTIKLWDIATRQNINTITGHSGDVKSIAFSPDGEVLASGSNDKTIKLWQLTTGREINTLFGHSNQVKSIAFNPNGKILASASIDKTIKLWKVED
jgi:WD40 repeat protein/predicted Ser/Thr protein kinase